MQRTFDIVMSVLILLTLAPLMAVSAVLIRVLTGSPVVFRQQRVGLHGQNFEILKFRTMSSSEDSDKVATDGDARVTKVGSLLRRTRFDEFPQFVNVLRGDMSIVGPRPELPLYVDLRPELFATVLQVRPGITDPGSLEFRDEGERLARVPENEREAHYLDVLLPEKLKISENYLRMSNRPLSDLGIIAVTVFGRSKKETK